MWIFELLCDLSVDLLASWNSKKKKYILAFIVTLLFTLCLYLRFGHEASQKDPWIPTVATITSEKFEDRYIFTIIYDASKSTAVNAEGKKILGPIQQSGMTKKKPIDGQKVRIKYRKNEPIVFEMIDSMRFVTGADNTSGINPL